MKESVSDMVETVLEPNLASPRSARQFCLATLHDWGVTIDEEAVAVAASELVTNAVQYGGPPISIRLRQRPETVVVEVDDGGAIFDLHAVGRWPGGRGLQMVGALSVAWGIEPLGAGKRMWCEFDANRSSSATR
jgi:anti-sigma regulatory factor (Ser/Thr protein kinase)